MIEFETLVQKLHWISSNCGDTLQIHHNKAINKLELFREKNSSSNGLFELARLYDPSASNGLFKNCTLQFQKDKKRAFDYYKRAANIGNKEALDYLIIHKII